MNFDLTEGQRLIMDTARRFLAEHYPIEHVRRVEAGEEADGPDRWCLLMELGWPALTVPEDYGGAGGFFLDLAVLLVEAGRHLMTGPFLAHAGTVLALRVVGRDPASWELLTQVCAGKAILTWAHCGDTGPGTPPGSRPVAQRTAGGSWTLSGRKRFIPHGEDATHLLITADTPAGVKAFAVVRGAPGMTLRTMRTVGYDRQADGRFEETPATPLTDEADDGPAVERADLLVTAMLVPYMVGAAERVLEFTVQYTKDRQQFGRPIGAFQAIQHHCATMVTEVDLSRLLMYEMAWRLDDDLEKGLEAVPGAKAFVSRAFRRVTATGHQVHGGVSVIKEHHIYLYSQKAKALELEQGQPEEHLMAVALQLGV